MLMLFIAPAVSTSLALSYNQNVVVSIAATDCVTDIAHHDGHTTNTAQHGATHNDMMVGHATCGYCVLLTHLPLLNTTFKADVHSVILLTEISPALFIYSKVIDETYSESLPRAPPLISS